MTDVATIDPRARRPDLLGTIYIFPTIAPFVYGKVRPVRRKRERINVTNEPLKFPSENRPPDSLGSEALPVRRDPSSTLYVRPGLVPHPTESILPVTEASGSRESVDVGVSRSRNPLARSKPPPLFQDSVEEGPVSSRWGAARTSEDVDDGRSPVPLPGMVGRLAP